MITPLMFLQFSTAFKMQVADTTGPQFQQHPFVPLYHLVVSGSQDCLNRMDCLFACYVMLALTNEAGLIDVFFDMSQNTPLVRNSLKHGFDIYATDWGTPSAYDKDLTYHDTI